MNINSSRISAQYLSIEFVSFSTITEQAHLMGGRLHGFRTDVQSHQQCLQYLCEK
jgi:hypothetical protein